MGKLPTMAERPPERANLALSTVNTSNVPYLTEAVFKKQASIRMSSLNGKVIVVTGGASGIGLATVQRLLSLGALVAVADLPKTTPETLENLQPSSEYFLYQSTDVTSRASCASFIDHVIQKFGRVDGLVNNAGVIPYEGEMASDELYDTVVGVNVNGVWFMGTEVIKRISQAGHAGAIVTTASDAALRGIQGSPVYCMTKHAVLGLTRAWSKDWCGRGIRVNAIAPGKLAPFPLLILS
jgi:NAD(P)-dependent dehydrogenase (short-subunit alcohol dehydrogenase family)